MHLAVSATIHHCGSGSLDPAAALLTTTVYGSSILFLALHVEEQALTGLRRAGVPVGAKAVAEPARTSTALAREIMFVLASYAIRRPDKDIKTGKGCVKPNYVNIVASNLPTISRSSQPAQKWKNRT